MTVTFQPTEHGIDVAAAALGKASLYDPTIRGGDPMVIAAWAQLLDDLDADEAVAAVDKHYAQPNPIRLLPGAILALVRAARQDSVLRQVVRRREIEAPRDPEASHRGYLAAMREVQDALRAAGKEPAETFDLSARCGFCGARPLQPCTNNGAPRTTPHPSRLEQVSA